MIHGQVVIRGLLWIPLYDVVWAWEFPSAGVRLIAYLGLSGPAGPGVGVAQSSIYMPNWSPAWSMRTH